MRNFAVALWRDRIEGFFKSALLYVIVYLLTVYTAMFFFIAPYKMRCLMKDGLSMGEFVSWLIQ